jgi:hypothetical protein
MGRRGSLNHKAHHVCSRGDSIATGLQGQRENININWMSEFEDISHALQYLNVFHGIFLKSLIGTSLQIIHQRLHKILWRFQDYITECAEA